MARWQPYAELQRRGYGAWFRHKDDPETSRRMAYLAATRLEAVVLPRMSWTRSDDRPPLDRSLHNAGLAVIYDSTTTCSARRSASASGHDRTRQESRRARAATGATASPPSDCATASPPATIELAACHRPVRRHARAHVVPNGIDIRWFQSCAARRAQRTVPPLTIGWAGGARYAEDLEPIAEAWHNLARRYPDVPLSFRASWPMCWCRQCRLIRSSPALAVGG